MSSPFIQADAPKEISEVNVVPLADVSLVLLIILLVLSPMMRQSMLQIKAAAESTKKEVVPPEELLLNMPPELVLVVSLTPDGPVVGTERFNDQGSFIGYMQAELARRADKKVFLAPHPDIPVGLVVHTLETIKTCGAESVALVQSQEEAATPPNGQVPAAAPAP